MVWPWSVFVPDVISHPRFCLGHGLALLVSVPEALALQSQVISLCLYPKPSDVRHNVLFSQLIIWVT